MTNKKMYFKKTLLPIFLSELISLSLLIAFFILSYYFTSGIGYTFSVIFEILTTMISFVSYLLLVLYFGLRKSKNEMMTKAMWNRYYRGTFFVLAGLSLFAIAVYILLANYPPADYLFVKIVFIVYDIVIILGVVLSPVIYLTFADLSELRDNYNQPIVTHKNDSLPPTDYEEKNQ